MNTTLLLTGLLLLAPAAYTVDLAAEAAPECMGTPCDEINQVCGMLGGGQCLGRAAATDECMGFPCDEINRVCETTAGQPCVRNAAEVAPVEARAASDQPIDCASQVCGEVNDRVCQPLFGIDCLYMAGGAGTVARAS